jgi:hypothetical protein
MNIEFLYFDECPHWTKALQNLQEVISEGNYHVILRIIRVDSYEKAREVNFQGSPSVKINGKDWEGSNNPPGLGCRLYRIQGKSTGVPSCEFIRQRLSRLAK